jgi:hypothetical protein
MSLFEVAFAKVLSFARKQPLVNVSKVVNISPIGVEYCMSTHPRERPELKAGMKAERRHGELIMESNCTVTVRRLRRYFPGLAALLNFFDVAASRRAASKSTDLLPPEVYTRILDFVDYNTWKTCSTVSSKLRSCCFLKYRLNDRIRIVAGPFVRVQGHKRERLLSFDFEVFPVLQVSRPHWTNEYNWMPVRGCSVRASRRPAGGDRKR